MDTIVGIALAIAVAWILLIAALWLVRPRGVGLADVVKLVPAVLRLARDLITDPAAPKSVRFALVVLVVWLLSPIDLVPEFVPVLGPVDDAIVAVLILGFVRRRLGTAELQRRWSGTAAGWELLARLVGARTAGGPSSS